MKLVVLQKREIFTWAISNTRCKMLCSTFANSIRYRCCWRIQKTRSQAIAFAASRSEIAYSGCLCFASPVSSSILAGAGEGMPSPKLRSLSSTVELFFIYLFFQKLVFYHFEVRSLAYSLVLCDRKSVKSEIMIG